MAVWDNLNHGEEYNSCITKKMCFSHFMRDWDYWMSQRSYIVGFRVNLPHKEFRFDLGGKIIEDPLILKQEQKFINKFVRELLKLFPEAKRYPPSKIYNKQDFKHDKWFWFKTDPSKWKCYPAFMMCFGVLRMIEEYPMLVYNWGVIDKQVGNELDFFQKLTIAHYYYGPEVNGHNVFDPTMISYGSQTIESQTWLKMKARIEENIWPRRLMYVGENISFKDPKIKRDGYDQDTFDRKKMKINTFTLKGFKECMEAYHTPTPTSEIAE